MENASEGTHSNKNSRSNSSEESAGLSASTFGLPATHTEDIHAKRNTHKLLRINHPYYRNVAKRNFWRESQIITFENAFHI